MGWRREPLCRYCLSYGHTRRNCPSAPESVKQRYAQMAKNRRCNYCANTGHNRASCDARKNALAKFKRDELLRRAAINDMYKRHGFGVGTVLSYEIPSWMRSSYYDLTSSDSLDTLVITKTDDLTYSGELQFEAHSSVRNKKVIASIATRDMLGSAGYMLIKWRDSIGNENNYAFHPDFIADMLTPASGSGNIFEDRYLTDVETVTSIPDNIADSVRSKKK